MAELCAKSQMKGLYRIKIKESRTILNLMQTEIRQDMEKRVICFSPPDISEKEITEVAEALRSGWITTGPRTKMLERRLAAYIETGRTDVDCSIEEAIKRYGQKVVCLSSATAEEELNLHILGVGSGDEVIVPAYTYTSSALAAIHCGATVEFVDIQKDGDPRSHMRLEQMSRHTTLW